MQQEHSIPKGFLFCFALLYMTLPILNNDSRKSDSGKNQLTN